MLLLHAHYLHFCVKSHYSDCWWNNFEVCCVLLAVPLIMQVMMTNGKPLPHSSRRYRFSYYKLVFRHEMIIEVIIMNEKLYYNFLSRIVTSLLLFRLCYHVVCGRFLPNIYSCKWQIRRVAKLRHLYEWHKVNIGEKPLRKISEKYSVAAVFVSSLDCHYSYVP